MRTIALEEHFLAHGYGIDPGDNAAFNPPTAQLRELGDTRLKEMNAGGIDVQVLSHTVLAYGGPTTASDWLRFAKTANEQLASAIAAHPDRFAGFAALPMVDPKAAADELERTVKSLGFKGAMINGTTEGRFLDDPFFFPVLERAAELNVPIYLHPGPPPEPVYKAYYSGLDPHLKFTLAAAGWGWHAETGLHVLRIIMAGIFDRLPGLQIIIGHMGEMIPFMLARIDDWLTPLGKNLQRTVAEYIQENIYITTSGFFTDPPLLLALQTIGADRILFSVDYPYSSIEQGRKFLDNVSVSAADKKKICHLNAERLLRLT